MEDNISEQELEQEALAAKPETNAVKPNIGFYLFWWVTVLGAGTLLIAAVYSFLSYLNAF